MEPRAAAAAAVFLWTFLALAMGSLGRWRVRRGTASLVGGLVTALILGVPWSVVDLQVLGLLAGLMVLAGLAEAGGLFAGLRRRLLGLPPWLALWAALLVVALASAVLLNDAAVVVLVPFLLPVLAAVGVPLAPAAALAAVAANIGSLLTPFGNPQNAVLARHAGLGVLDFLRVQGPLVAAGMGLLALASRAVARGAAPAAPPPTPAAAHARPWLLVCIAAFVALAAAGVALGTAALACAAAAWLGLRTRLGRGADRAAWRNLDGNVLALFVGLYFLTAGLSAWFPAGRLRLAGLDGPVEAATATTVLSNLVGNVPAMLAFIRLDPAWTREHAAFLVTTSTLGGSLLVTGSAASLLAADQARRLGVEVGFWLFLRHALWVLPVLVAGAWLTWPGATPTG